MQKEAARRRRVQSSVGRPIERIRLAESFALVCDRMQLEIGSRTAERPLVRVYDSVNRTGER